MSNYTHLTLKERKKLFAYLQMGLSIKELAKRMKRHRSTIYRELNRNSEDKYYTPCSANAKMKLRYSGRPKKIHPDTALYYYIVRQLKKGWSPEQISGRLKLENKPYYVCHETIYQYIYQRSYKNMYHLLARKKPCRGKRYGRKHRSGKYLYIKSIHDRPSKIEARRILGHWEGDTIAFASSKYENITTLVERKTRFIMLKKNNNRKTNTVMPAISSIINKYPRKMWKTLTLDQGSEFSDFYEIERQTKCITYFCDPHSPWQRGSNENTNGRLRRFLPRTIEISKITQNELDKLSKNLNNTPRKCLGFMTPKEALFQDCRSICRFSF
jgi:transposase, IS30 family